MVLLISVPPTQPSLLIVFVYTGGGIAEKV